MVVPLMMTVIWTVTVKWFGRSLLGEPWGRGHTVRDTIYFAWDVPEEKWIPKKAGGVHVGVYPRAFCNQQQVTDHEFRSVWAAMCLVWGGVPPPRHWAAIPHGCGGKPSFFGGGQGWTRDGGGTSLHHCHLILARSPSPPPPPLPSNFATRSLPRS